MIRIMEVEPVATPFIGYRMWTINGGSLQPLMYNHIFVDWWTTGTAKAQCLRQGHYEHHPWEHDTTDVPYPPCTCGLWAYNTLERNGMRPTGSNEVKGAIVAWGRIVEHEYGFRSQYAQVIAFLDEGHTYISELGEDYGVDVIASLYGVPALLQSELLQYTKWWV
jgi:hypothetical protein